MYLLNALFIIAIHIYIYIYRNTGMHVCILYIVGSIRSIDACSNRDNGFDSTGVLEASGLRASSSTSLAEFKFLGFKGN